MTRIKERYLSTQLHSVLHTAKLHRLSCNIWAHSISFGQAAAWQRRMLMMTIRTHVYQPWRLEEDMRLVSNTLRKW